MVCRDACTDCTREEAWQELQHEAVWYLVNSVRPLNVQAKTVLSASFSNEVSKVSNDIM